MTGRTAAAGCGAGVMFVAALCGCTGSPRPSTVIARAGSAELTLEEARQLIDTAAGPFGRQLPKLVGAWVNEQVLFEEAQRRGIEASPAFQRKLNEATRQLAVQQLLQEVVDADTAGVVEADQKEYFERHASEFSIREDVVAINLALFSSREAAEAFAAACRAEGSSWSLALNTLASDSAFAAHLIAHRDGVTATQSMLSPPELWDAAWAGPAGEVSLPVATPEGFAVVEPLSAGKAGKQADFGFVRDEVRARFFVERRRLRTEELLGTLRKQYNVEVLMHAVPDSLE